MGTKTQHLLARANRPVDIASLAAFRILFGGLMFISMVRFMAKGWVDDLYVKPTFYFTYYGFSWVQPWPEWGMYLHFILLAVLALCIAFGLFYRTTTTLFFLGFTYVELIDQTNYLNHYYFISLITFLMIFLPPHRSWSLDVRRKPSLYSPTVPAYSRWILIGQISIVYFFAGLAKLNPDWLFRAQPLSIWLSARAGIPLLGPLFAQRWVAYLMSWGGALFDLTIPGWLLWERSRPFAYSVVIIFHLLTALLFYIGMFPWIMIVCTLLYFSPSWPRRLFRQLPITLKTAIAKSKATRRSLSTAAQHAANVFSAPSRISHSRESGNPARYHRPWYNRLDPRVRGDDCRKNRAPMTQPAERVHAAPLRAPAAVAIGIWFLLQITLPLRHHLYPGTARWTGEGYRFAWTVMLVEKAGYVEFHVRAPIAEKRWTVYPASYLTPLQEKMMATRPNMILQFAHYLGGIYRKKGFEDVEVYAEAYVSLNGRPSQLLIDPSVNLLEKERSLQHKTWILPLR